MVGTSHDSTVRAILYAFFANFGIAIAKTWAAWVTGSGSMLAEAIHSYADTGNQNCWRELRYWGRCAKFVK